MRLSLARMSVLSLALIATTLSACSDDEVLAPGTSVAGTWNATSFTALGSDFIDEGMGLSVALTGGGSYTFTATNDLVGICGDDGPDCTDTGSYSSTASTLTLDAGTADAITFNYSIQGNTMTWSGSIDSTPATITWTKQ